MKSPETLKIETILLQNCFAPNNPSLAKSYASPEVTIGFQRDHKGHERVDFLSYDPKEQIFKCYEIKVSMSDFKSNAKLSWYGHYNYLVITKELFLEKPLQWWRDEVPEYVGIIVVDTKNEAKKSIKKATKGNISLERYEMLKDSLIRTLFYSNCKSRKLQNL